jgi:hypothetical protein
MSESQTAPITLEATIDKAVELSVRSGRRREFSRLARNESKQTKQLVLEIRDDLKHLPDTQVQYVLKRLRKQHILLTSDFLNTSEPPDHTPDT